MALEFTGLALGVVSLLASFKGAIEGYQFLSDAATAFEDSSFLLLKMKVEQQRLRIWGDFYDFNDSGQCQKLQSESPHVRSLILYILMEIETTSTNVEKLSSRYGLKLLDTAAEVQKTPDLYTKVSPGSDVVKKLARRQTAVNKLVGNIKKGVRWTVSDGAKFEKLIDRLEYLNDSLEHVVPRGDMDLISLGLSSYILPWQEDITAMNAMQNSALPILASCATMKRVQMTKSGKTRVDIPSVPYSNMQYGATVQGTRIALSTLSGYGPEEQEVLVEWKQISRGLQPQERDLVFSRIRDLCRLLTTPKPPQFGLLHCVGLVEDEDYAMKYTGHKRLGFVFRYPTADSGAPYTLKEMYTVRKAVPLGDRFRLAQALASSVLLLHSSKWLHKSIRSNNVLLFPNKKQADPTCTSVVSPYLVGFEYTRHDRVGEQSLENNQEVDLYRHPDWKSGFSRLSDIYSLGILLFEIAVWRPIESDKYRTATEAEMKTRLERNVHVLIPVMGETYCAVMRKCLTGELGTGPDSADLDKLFWSQVVKELGNCRA